MKRYIILTTLATLAASAATAQTVVDAVRYGNKEIIGTARYRSMAGAFGALGGDPTVMNDNPAGLAIYRGTSLFSFTPHLAFTHSQSDGTEKGENDGNCFTLPNFAGIVSIKNDDTYNMVNFNLGFSINRQAEVRSKYDIVLDEGRGSFGNYLKNQANSFLNGKLSPKVEFVADDWAYSQAPILSMIAYNAFAIDDDVYNPHAVIDPMEGAYTYQRLSVEERTRQDNYNISGAANFGDQFYVGATLRITDFNSVIRTEFDEDYDYNYEGSYIAYDNNFEAKGSGFGLNVGVLWAPTDALRVGAAIHTPTWGDIVEIYEGTMTTDDERLENDWVSYYDEWRYDFSTPWEYQLSAAYIVGNRGLISLEYDMRDFTTMEYSDNIDYKMPSSYFSASNDAINKYLTKQHTIKVGGEWRATDKVSLRAGYAHQTSPFTDEAYEGRVATGDQNITYYNTTKPNFQTLGRQYYTTCGAGWRGKSWTFDLSYMYHNTKQMAAAYPGDYSVCEPVEVDFGQHNWDLTLSYRF